jgi:hypothetical protein
VKREVRAELAGASFEEVERTVRARVLERASDLERLRRSYHRLLEPLATKLAPIARDDVVLLWAFSTQSMNEAIFDPLAQPPRLPAPSDLAPPPGQDGFPPGSTASLELSAEIDAASAVRGVLAFELAGGSLRPLADAAIAADGAARRVLVSRPGGWRCGSRVVLLAVGGENGLENRDTTLAASPRRSAPMELALGAHPLCSFDPETRSCADVGVAFLGEGAAGRERATRLELVRRGHAPLLALLESTTAIRARDLVALWSFTVAAAGCGP